MKAKKTAAAPQAAAPGVPWTDVLVTELSRRFALLAAAMGEQAADPLLKGVLVSDAEVKGLLAHHTLQGAAPFTPGSLMQHVAEHASPAPEHLLALAQRFGLSGFEIDCLLVCLAADIAQRFERVFAYLNDSINAKLPGADILLRTVAPAQLSLQAQLGRDGRLQRHGLLIAVDGARFGPYRVADGVARYALGQAGFDALLTQAWCDADVPPLAKTLWDMHADASPLHELLNTQFDPDAHDNGPLVIGLRARAGSGRQHAVEQACQRAGMGCIALDARKLKTLDLAQRTLTAALRDSVLLGSAVLIHHADVWLDDAALLNELRPHVQALVRELGWVLVFASEGELHLGPWFPAARVVDLTLPPLTAASREAAWLTVLAQFPTCPADLRTAIAAALGGKFRLSLGEIALAAQRVASTALPTTPTAWSDLLHRVAGQVATPRLAQLAQALTVKHTLSDLVLPADRMAALNDVVRRVRHRSKVLEQWGLEGVSNRGRGLIALFHGASGTGKTMAAEAIASALRMQLFRIDLAGVVSKYIGETEKNLRAIFEEADRADAVLFFDEADALFGKRSEVKDAHDRYANIEINYLLQRIELFEGIAVLATNMRAHIDEAFLRRIHITVEFPLPREAERLGLWDRSFPPSAPLDDSIDWSFLAQRFELTGGAIRNAALGAAFLAADGAGVIGMPEVVNALRTELVKAGKRVSDGEFGPYARHLSVAKPAARATRLRTETSSVT